MAVQKAGAMIGIRGAAWKKDGVEFTSFDECSLRATRDFLGSKT